MKKCKRNSFREKRFLKLLEDLRKTMENYPDGKITDLIGANHVYELMNRAMKLGRSAGFTAEEIELLLKACREAPSEIAVDPCAPDEHKSFEERRNKT